MTTQGLETNIELVKESLIAEKDNIEYHVSEIKQHEIAEIEQRRQLILLQDQQLKAKEEKYNPNWKPEPNEDYWSFSFDGTIIKQCWFDDAVDNWRLTSQIVFKTEEQCKKGKQAIELMAEFLEYGQRWCLHIYSLKLMIYRIAVNDTFLLPSKLVKKFGDRIQELKEYL